MDTLKTITTFNPPAAYSGQHMGGWLYRWRFDNNIEVSVIRHTGSYGGTALLYEMMAYGPEDLNIDQDLREDIRGWMSLDQVNTALQYLQNQGKETI
jgi:hypothetical protein